LYIPEKIEAGKPFLEFSIDQFVALNSRDYHEFLLNILIFIPLAFLLYAVLSHHMKENWRALLVVVIIGGALTLSSENLQYFSQSRISSLVDVIANLIGIMLGVLFKLSYDIFLKRNKKSIHKAIERHATSNPM
jgi:glycopeptide antibiotics resistance protein